MAKPARSYHLQGLTMLKMGQLVTELEGRRCDEFASTRAAVAMAVTGLMAAAGRRGFGGCQHWRRTVQFLFAATS